MNLTDKVLTEILETELTENIAQRAYLSALLHNLGEVNISRGKCSIEIESVNYNVIERALESFSSVFGGGAELIRKTDSNIYKLRIGPERANEVLEELHISKGLNSGFIEGFYEGVPKEFTNTQKALSPYMQGVFVSTGSVYFPENTEDRGYHLEMSFLSGAYCESIANILEGIGLSFKISERKNSFALYSKNSESIIEFLYLIEASECASEVVNVFAERSLSEKATRESNCRVANMDKSYRASSKYIRAINKLQESGRLVLMSEPLRQVALTKLKHPNATLDQLAEILGITKSGVNHRLRKIVENAKED